MRRFVLGWKMLGHEQRLEAHIVNYADDFVICCRGKADKAMAAMRDMMERLKLTVNEEKTQLCRLPEETFDFLGYTFGRCYSRQTGRAYLGTRPSKKSIKRMCDEISEVTDRPNHVWRPRTGRGQTQPEAGRLGELLLSGASQSEPIRPSNTHVRNGSASGCVGKHKVRGKGCTLSRRVPA